MYTLEVGRFVVGAKIADRNACGPVKVRGEFHAQAKIVVEELDESGYVVHTETFLEHVHRHFSAGTFEASCEQLAEGVARIAYDMVSDKVISVEATVIGSAGKITYAWKRGHTQRYPRHVMRQPQAIVSDEIRGN